MSWCGASSGRPFFSNIPKFSCIAGAIFNRRDDGKRTIMCKDDDDLLLQHISEAISKMKPGDTTDCEGRIAPDVWNPTPPRERRNAFGRPVSRLVAEGKVPLVFSHLDSKRHNVYVRI